MFYYVFHIANSRPQTALQIICPKIKEKNEKVAMLALAVSDI